MRRRLKAAARGTFNAMAVAQTMRIDSHLKFPLLLLAFLLVLGTEAGTQQVSFHITPVRPVEQLRAEALKEQPPPENGTRLNLGNAQASDLFFRRMRLGTPAEMGVQVTELQGVCDERRQLDLQTRYQHWLHGWLLVHVPFSVALLVLTVWHAVVAQFFR